MSYNITYYITSILITIFFMFKLGFRGCSTANPHDSWRYLDYDICGLSFTDRIIGGTNATLGQYPWLARIGYIKIDRAPKIQFKCGGVLINQNYILTASHCVVNLPKATVVDTIRLGEFNTGDRIDCDYDVCAEPVQDFRPSKILYHARYGAPPYKNDIALIRLERPAVLNGWVNPICLPSGPLLDRDFVGTIAEVAGWGVTNVKSRAHKPVLQRVQVPIVERQRCVDTFTSFTDVGPTQLCAGGIGGQDSCAGDSGGPLMKVDASYGSPRYYAVGLVSFGAKKCGSPVPAVYTRIGSYMSWILDHIEA